MAIRLTVADDSKMSRKSVIRAIPARLGCRDNRGSKWKGSRREL